MTIRRSLVSALTLVAAVLVVPVGAQQHATVERGFRSEKSFQVGDIDHVNLLNGNLVVTLPIGSSYETAGGFRYGLTLVYNSSIWDFEADDALGLTYAYPHRLATAGLGWTLSLGRLIEPADLLNTAFDWNYIAPDGSEHSFYDTLSPGQTMTTGVRYSRDLTYMRLVDGPAITWDGRTNLPSKVIQAPDGEKRTFAKYGNLDWRIVRIEDPFANYLTVEYNQSATCGGTCWLLKDNYSRTHQVLFQTLAGTQPSQVVASVVLSGNRTYGFEYSTPTISRGCPHNDPDGNGNGNLDTYVKVPTLNALVQPDGSRWVMGYNLELLPNICSVLAGRMTSLTLPTKGRIDWSYGNYFMTSSEAGCQVKAWITRATGVVQRTVTAGSPAGGTSVGTWTYLPQSSPPPTPLPACNPPRERVTVVTTPLKDREEHYFEVFRIGTTDLAGWEGSDFGLPLSRYRQDGTSGRFLSTRIFDCDDAGNCPTNPVREIYMSYEKDQWSQAQAADDDVNRNRRPSSQTTKFNENADAAFESFADETSSNWDGLGHYRQTTLGGNFGAGDVKTSFTAWNGSSGQAIPAPGAPWILDTFGEQRTTQGSFTSVVQNCFDVGGPVRGFLSRKRVHEGTTAGNHDFISTFTPDGSGNVVTEEYFGGDLNPVGTGDVCNPAFGLPSNQFRIDHAITSILRKSFYVTENNLPFSYSFQDETLDLATGEVTAGRDTTGLQTTYLYDNMGRMTRVSPATGHGGQVRYTYFMPTLAQPSVTPRVEIQRRDNAGSAVLAENKIEVDGLGRVARAFEKLPIVGFVSTDTKYDEAGNQISTSELGTPSKVTTSSNFDPFGRPGTITAPDGHSTTLSYVGVKKVDRTVTVGTSYNSTAGQVVESNAVTTETYDRQGRLSKVTEPSGTNNANVTTTYGYDDANRLRTVATTSGTVTQNRSFAYDGRGVMKSETLPEKGGASGNGIVSYSLFDSRGRATRRQDGPHDLTFSFDRAERLVQVKNTTGGKLWKEFQYAANNNGSDLRRGKVITATRYNYPVLSGVEHPAIVTENYSYAGRDGRISQRTTGVTYDGSTAGSFSQTFTYDPLGNVSVIDYPQCTHAACSALAATPRSIAPTFTDGYLTALGTYAPSITYHPNGQVAQINHGNGTRTLIANDPNGMRRPLSFQAQAQDGTPLWTTGNYAYDGTGNITKIGGQWFTYDKVSRLSAATQELGATGGGTVVSQTYGYDAFGNLQSITGNAGRTTPTSSATNRLTSPGTVYDTAGNMTSWSGATYQYDAMDRMWRMQNGAEDWIYVYTPDDERIWSIKVGGNNDTWSIRDLNQKVLRDYTRFKSDWSVTRDYLYRGSLLLGAIAPKAPRYYHLDHLGTPRLTTSIIPTPLGYHVYYPYGEEATDPNQNDVDRMKFTGHERDLGSAEGTGDDLDYMHARFCSPITGRFLGVDIDLGTVQAPQSWNRYAYVRGNPINGTDPLGLWPLFIQLPYFSDSITVVGKAVSPLARSTADRLLEARLRLTSLLSIADAIFAPGIARHREPPHQKGGVEMKLGIIFPIGPFMMEEDLLLQKQLASEQQLGEIQGEPEEIAGPGMKRAVADIDRILAEHGGNAEEWFKVRSSNFKAADGTSFEVHAYRNIRTGQVVEVKTKFQ